VAALAARSRVHSAAAAAQFPARRRGADQGQFLQRMSHSGLLPGRPERQSALPVEPVGTGLGDRIRPALAAIELRDPRQPAAGWLRSDGPAVR
jgi:hypothetical protein